MTPVRWPRFVTASKWSTIAEQLMGTVRKARARDMFAGPAAQGGAFALPRLTNGDVITMTMGLLGAVPPPRAESFPLWDQFAAAAYGYAPPSRKLVATDKQRDAWYPNTLSREFWGLVVAVTDRLDETHVANPRVDLDGQFSDRVFQGEVVNALHADGAQAQFKIPVGCRNKDGTTRTLLPKCKKRMDRFPWLCLEYEKCDDPITIDDPITAVKKRADKFAHLVILALVFWAVLDNKPRPTRRK